MTEIDLGPFQVLQEMCSACSSIFQRTLDMMWLSCRAAIDLILFNCFWYLLLIPLIFSANSGICTLQWSGVALLTVLVESGVVCQCCATPIGGLVIFCEGSA